MFVKASESACVYLSDLRLYVGFKCSSWFEEYTKHSPMKILSLDMILSKFDTNIHIEKHCSLKCNIHVHVSHQCTLDFSIM